MCTMAHAQRSKDKRELILSLWHMGSGTELSSIRLASVLSHLPSLGKANLKDSDFSKLLQGMVAHACNLSTGKTEAWGL